MENLYDITKECKILDSEFNRYSFLLESDDNIINNYYLTGETLFLEADDSNKKQSIISSMIEAIKRFITKCKARFFKLIGSDKYKQYETELSKNKELGKKEVKYNPKTKEFEILEKDTKDINKIIEKIKNGTATDEEIERLENQVHSHKALATTAIVGGAGLFTFTLNELIGKVRKDQDEKEKILDDDFQFIYQSSLLDPNKHAFSDKQIRQLQKAFALVKDNAEERNKLLLDARKKMDAILDTEMKALLSEHEKSSKESKEYAEKQIGFGKKSSIEKFRSREEKSKQKSDNYDAEYKDMSDDEKQSSAKKLRDEIEDNKKYSGKSLKNRAARAADRIIYRTDYKYQKREEKKNKG